MTGPFPEWTGTAARPGAKPFKGWAFSDNRLFDQQSVHPELGIVFRVGDRAFQRFFDE